MSNEWIEVANKNDLEDLYDKLCDEYGCLKEELEGLKATNDYFLKRIVELEEKLKCLEQP